MTEKEAQKVLDELQGVRPEMLNGEAKRLFEAIMKIADERDELRETVERQNLEIMAQKDAHDFDAEITNDVNEIAVKLYKELEERDQIINAMVEYIANLDIDEDICKKMGIFQDCEIKDVENCKKCIIEYFKNKVRQKCDTDTTKIN
jgi:hypothetical protein